MLACSSKDVGHRLNVVRRQIVLNKGQLPIAALKLRVMAFILLLWIQPIHHLGCNQVVKEVRAP